MTEDISFYVEEAKGCHGARRRARRRLRADRRAARAGGPPGDRGRPLGGDARRSPGRSPRSTASATRSTCASATCASRRSTSACELVICPFRSLLHMPDEEEKLRALRAARDLLAPGGRFVFDVFAPSPRGHRRDARALARARARHLRARRLGRGDADAATLRALGRFLGFDGAALALCDRVAPPDRRGRARGRRASRAGSTAARSRAART